MSNKINIKNKKASFEYELLEKFIAGIILAGTEIKSIRSNKANISDAHCVFIKKELFIKNLHISEYKSAGNTNHKPKRDRKLLLNRIELKKIESKVKEKGNTIIPIRLFINDKGKAKLEISLAKGKKIHDKRESIKEKELKIKIQKLKKLNE